MFRATKTPKTRYSMLCLELHGTLIGSFRAALLLMTIDHIESMPVSTASTTAKTCPCWISDHRTLAINLSTCSHTSFTAGGRQQWDSSFSRNRRVQVRIRLGSEQNPCYLSGNNISERSFAFLARPCLVLG